MKAYRDCGSTAPLILELSTIQKKVVSLTPWLLYLWKKHSTENTKKRRLGMPKIQSGHKKH
jgi:hypothetical protein